jgi:uncharacterized protein YndB with AHSA1/START domain
MPTIEREIELDAPADVVWRALTDADELAEWFGADVDGDLLADGAVSIGDRLALLTDIDEDRSLGFRWLDGGAVTFTITPGDDGRTSLRVIETHASAAAGGWNARLTALAAGCGRLVLA